MQKLNQQHKHPIMDQWVQIFDEVTYDFVPPQYWKQVKVSFTDGDIKYIDLDQHEFDNISELVERLTDAFEQSVIRMDFQLDMEQVKHDVSIETTRFLSQA